MTASIVSVVFLVVSALSLVWQSTALVRLIRCGTATRANRGLVRTAGCRVAASVLYVGLGLVVLVLKGDFPVLGLTVFVFVQLLWQANSFADVRLRLRETGALPRSTKGRHRRGR